MSLNYVRLVDNLADLIPVAMGIAVILRLALNWLDTGSVTGPAPTEDEERKFPKGLILLYVILVVFLMIAMAKANVQYLK